MCSNRNRGMQNPPSLSLCLLAALVGCAVLLRQKSSPCVLHGRSRRCRLPCFATSPAHTSCMGVRGVAAHPAPFESPWQLLVATFGFSPLLGKRRVGEDFQNPPFSDFTILLRPKIQGSRPWLPARRFAPRPPLPKGEGICLYDRAASITARSGLRPSPPFFKGGA